MRNEWLPSKEKINGKPCLQHRSNMKDRQIFGRYGVILQTGPKTFKAIIDRHNVFNLIAMELSLNRRIVKGEEDVISFEHQHFETVFKALKVPRRLTAQVQYSKRFS